MATSNRIGMLLLLVLAGLYLGWRGEPARPAVTEEEKQQIFGAVESYLRAANLPPQDLPKRILSVEQVGDRKYKVHMEMGKGEGWFEVSRKGDTWEVRGLPAPGPSAHAKTGLL